MKYCINCGKKLKNFYAKRCKKCYKQWIKIPENASNYKDGRTHKKYFCIDCGQKISNHSGRKRFNKHRCKSCAKKGRRSPFFIDGKGIQKYPQKFSYALKEQIRKRDNYICQNCGIIQKIHKKYWHKILEIHHIDHNRNNNQKENLITLCHKCNTRANFNINYWINFYKKIIKRIYNG